MIAGPPFHGKWKAVQPYLMLGLRWILNSSDDGLFYNYDECPYPLAKYKAVEQISYSRQFSFKSTLNSKKILKIRREALFLFGGAELEISACWFCYIIQSLLTTFK